MMRSMTVKESNLGISYKRCSQLYIAFLFEGDFPAVVHPNEVCRAAGMLYSSWLSFTRPVATSVILGQIELGKEIGPPGWWTKLYTSQYPPELVVFWDFSKRETTIFDDLPLSGSSRIFDEYDPTIFKSNHELVVICVSATRRDASFGTQFCLAVVFCFSQKSQLSRKFDKSGSPSVTQSIRFSHVMSFWCLFYHAHPLWVLSERDGCENRESPSEAPE